MTKVIHKQVLSPGCEKYELPLDAKVRHVGFQGPDSICLWYEAQLAEGQPGYDWARGSRRFIVRPTGHPFKPSAYEKFIGTVVSPDGSLVFHIYEDLP